MLVVLALVLVSARARRRRSAVDATGERARRARQHLGDVGGARGRPPDRTASCSRATPISHSRRRRTRSCRSRSPRSSNSASRTGSRRRCSARGTQDGTVWHGDLFLKGFGDPTLTSARLGRLAQAIAEAGITRVDGRLYGDETWFDAKRAAPGWKLGYLIYECPPLSALVVDRAVYDGHTALKPALAAVGTFRRLLRGYGVTTGPVGIGRAPASATVLGDERVGDAAQRDRGHGPRQRQLPRRDAAQGARRRGGHGRHDRRRRGRRPPRPRRGGRPARRRRDRRRIRPVAPRPPHRDGDRAHPHDAWSDPALRVRVLDRAARRRRAGHARAPTERDRRRSASCAQRPARRTRRPRCRATSATASRSSSCRTALRSRRPPRGRRRIASRPRSRAISASE